MMMIRVQRVALLAVFAFASTSADNRSSAQPNAQSFKDHNVPVVISYDPNVLPLNSTIISSLLRDEQLNRRVRDKVDGIPAGLAFDLLVFPENERAGRITGLLSIASRLREEQPVAELDVHRLSVAVLEELEAALAKSAKQLERQYEDRWTLQRELLEGRRRELDDQLIRLIRSAGDVPAVDSAEELERISSKRLEAMLQLAGIEARRQALQDRVEHLKASSETAELDREIIEQLEQIFAFHGRKFERANGLRKANSISEQHLDEVEAELAKARIDLLRAKREAATKASPELTSLSAELSQATIAAAEQRAILQAIESRFKELRNALADQAQRMQDAQEAERRAAVHRDQLATIEKRLADLELEQLERMAARGGTVTIVPWSAPPEED